MGVRPTMAIVGGGLAGAKAAEGARAAGYDGRILLVGDEPALPYERPPLSKAILRGEADVDSASVHSAGFYDEHDIEVVTDKAVALDPVARRILLERGATITFDTAVLATGAAPRRLGVPGAALAGVHYLRTIDDAVRLRAAIGRAGRVAVVGAGWIGSEVAASARQLGADTVLIDPARVPLHRVLGDDIGEVFRGLHADHGVDLRLGVGVVELRGNEAVHEVVLNDGSAEVADVVVVGVGVLPRTELVDAASGIHVENGVVVDSCLQTTIPGVYAAGDVANSWHPHYGRHLRVEHWANALNQGTTAGGNAAGRADVYDRLPYFYSDQYDVGMEYVGHADAGDQVVIRGLLDERKFIAFWHRGGVVSAAMTTNVWDVLDDLKAIIATRRPVDLDRLTDPTIPLGHSTLIGNC